MNINKKLILIFVFIAFSKMSHAQGELDFKKLIHDFGNIEEGKEAKFEFVYQNSGNAPVIVSAAQPSCGCTIGEFTKEPVLPGKAGKVTAIYNTVNRPGSFYKTISVTNNGKLHSVLLTIKGTVVPKSQIPAVTAEQLKKSPILSLAVSEHNYGQVEKLKTVSTEIKLKNSGKSALKINSVSSPCHCFAFTVSNTSIAPGDSAGIEFKYTPRVVGERKEFVNVFSNDLNKPQIELQFQANVVESLTNPSVVKEEKIKAPF